MLLSAKLFIMELAIPQCQTMSPYRIEKANFKCIFEFCGKRCYSQGVVVSMSRFLFGICNGSISWWISMQFHGIMSGFQYSKQKQCMQMFLGDIKKVISYSPFSYPSNTCIVVFHNNTILSYIVAKDSQIG